ncbi:MAG: uroporphyrinogen-III synthase [Sneathiellales bacterium]|nr:uroporphyrinogen-III synthase [Sneathiellales bacterium]
MTRPEPDGSALSEKLNALGHMPFLSPVMEMKRLPLKEPDLEDMQALLLTSINALRIFCELTERRDLPLFAVGARSAEGAREVGFNRVYSADGDVDSLAELVMEKADPEAGSLLHIGGARLAGDLRGLLENAGFSYNREILYEMIAASQLQKKAEKALTSEELDGVLLFSPQTARIFKDIIERSGHKAHVKTMVAYCLSRNVKDALRGLDFKKIEVAKQPTEDHLLDLIEKAG